MTARAGAGARPAPGRGQGVGRWLGVAAGLAALPLVADGAYALTLASQTAIFAVFALSYSLLYGQAGLLSFGHAVYAGLGAYATIHLLAVLGTVDAGWANPMTVALLPLVGGLVGALCGAVFGYPGSRRAGTAFAMITLGIGEMVHAAALMFPAVFGGESGVGADRVVGRPLFGISFGPAIEVYYLTIGWCLVAAALIRGFIATSLGQLARAHRDDPERLGFLGYPPSRLRWWMLVVSGFFAGIAGGLGAINLERVTAENLSGLQSGAVLLAAVIGGSGLFAGPVLGAVVYCLFAVALSGLTPAWLLYLGLFFMAVVMFVPDGLAGLVATVGRLGREHRLAATLRDAGPTAAAAVVAVAMLVVVIELGYHRALDTIGQPVIRLFGLSLDSSDGPTWFVVLAGLGISLVAVGLARRRRRGPGR